MTERVTATYLKKNWNEVVYKAMRGPVIITTHGRDRCVLLSFDYFCKIKAALMPPVESS